MPRRGVQKAFWLRSGLAERLERVVRERRREDTTFSERRALALAIKAFVEQEEKGGTAPVSMTELLDQLDDVVTQVRAQTSKPSA